MKQPVSESWNDANNDFPLPFALVPWGQHIEIITRSESLEEALFYMQHVIEKGLSRTALVNCYKAHLYNHQGKIVNNFATYLPEPQSHLVQEVLKENYDFGFATVDHEPFEERELEEALTSDVTNLLLESNQGDRVLGYTLLWHCKQKSMRNIAIPREKIALFLNLYSQIILFSTFLIIFAHRTLNIGQE